VQFVAVSARKPLSGIFDLIATDAHPGSKIPAGAMDTQRWHTRRSLGQNVSFDPVTIVASRRNILKTMCPRLADPVRARSFSLSLLILDGLRHG